MTALDLFARETPQVTNYPESLAPNVALAWTPTGTYTITVAGAPAITLHGDIFKADARRLAEGLISPVRVYLNRQALKRMVEP